MGMGDYNKIEMAIKMIYKHQVFWVLGIIFTILGSRDYIYNFVGKGFKYDNVSFLEFDPKILEIG